MSADIVNLRGVRKGKMRAEKDARAIENRTKFGTPQRVSKLSAALREKEQQDLEGKKRED